MPSGDKRGSVTVIVPTLNEEESVGKVIGELKRAGYNNILVVDGYSDDATTRVSLGMGARVVMQRGPGKAGALATAFKEVATPYVLVIDGDGSYDPADIDKFLPSIGHYDLVKGVRERNENMSGLHRLGNSIITKTFDLLFGTFIGDVCSGMYLLRTELVKSVHLEKHPFTVEQEIAAEVILSSGSITTIPITYRRRYGGASKVKTWRQGFRNLYTNVDLARTHNPVLLFSTVATLILVPAFGLFGYVVLLYLITNQYHSGYLLASLVLLVLGSQGLVVATIAAMLRRIERKLSVFADS